MINVLSIGEIMVELSHQGNDQYIKSYAGDTFNFSYYLTAVSDGQISVDYLTVVGSDLLSQQCLEFIESKGISTAKCQRDSQRSIGLYMLTNDEFGEKQYHYWRDQSAVKYLFDSPQSLDGYDLVFLSGVTAAITDKRKHLYESIFNAKQAGTRFAFDYNYRKQLWTIEAATLFARQILPLLQLVKISDEDLDFLYPGKDIESLSHEFPEIEWVYTCGAFNAQVWENGKMSGKKIFAQEKNIVDTTAAGDSFFAAYVAAWYNGQSPEKRLENGHFIASQVVNKKGAIVAVEISR